MNGGTPLEELYGILPDLDELEDLRLLIGGAAERDPGREWDGPAISTTVDKRVIAPDALAQVLDESEQALRGYLAMLFDHLRRVVGAHARHDRAGVSRALIALGESLEQIGRLAKARTCFERALVVSLPLADKAPQIAALRRIARVARSLGELDDASLYYRRSADLAEASDDAREWVISTTGAGNVLAVQGRLADATRCYRTALRRAEAELAAEGGDALMLERAQLHTNLGMVATRQGLLDEAGARFADALRLWPRASGSSDLGACLYNQALLRRRQGREAEARAILSRTLDTGIAPWLAAMIAVELASSYLEDGHVGEAERWGREAEQQAIRSRSPYYLADTYRGLGRLVWAMGDENAVTFFEKALEIARKKAYLLVEGETLLDYARLRAETGQAEEAEAYLDRARDVFADLGAPAEVARVDAALSALRTEVAQTVE
jgi:tetratricopeptide (TPR) repeat protein